jgi:poly(hydroxyalkanoate) depolymerase family esterase
MLHGCNSTPTNQDGNGINAVADRENFVVLYPSHDQPENTDPGTHPLRCWRWFSPADMHRGTGDPATVARQTELVAAAWGTDRTRSYLVGMSSGAMMTSLTAASYPDVYAAIGVVAGCSYGGGAACVSEDYYKSDPSTAEAQAAHLEQGPRARLMPVIAIHGDADKTVPPAANPDVTRSWLKAGNLALSGTTARPLALEPASAVTRKPKDRYSYLDETYRDDKGRVVAQRVVVHGMDHFWPGGVSDEKFAPYTDAKGPSGAELTWSFLSRYRLIDGKTVFARK